MPSFLDSASLRASVYAGGRKLEVYDTQYDEASNTISGWIASEAGQEYTIKVRKQDLGKFDTTLSARLYLDGSMKKARSIILERTRKKALFMGVRTGQAELRPFVFSDLRTTGELVFSTGLLRLHSTLFADDDALLDQGTVASPGMIQLTVTRTVTNTISSGKKKKNYRDKELSNLVHEQSKKAGSHTTR